MKKMLEIRLINCYKIPSHQKMEFKDFSEKYQDKTLKYLLFFNIQNMQFSNTQISPVYFTLINLYILQVFMTLNP